MINLINYFIPSKSQPLLITEDFICEPRYYDAYLHKRGAKHRNLTGFLIKKCIAGKKLKFLLDNTECYKYVGELPPVLRGMVPKEKIAETTIEFRYILDDFLNKKASDLKFSKFDISYNLIGLEKLFGAGCRLLARKVSGKQDDWSGGFGTVFKISFDGISESFALKVFYNNLNFAGKKITNGPASEITNAFCISRAEPKNNNAVYMGSFGNVPYLLSKWGGDRDDFIKLKPKKNKMFSFCSRDEAFKNWRGGKRIDFGNVIKTGYGTLDYKNRKLYRKINAICESKNMDNFEKLYEINIGYVQRKNLCETIKSLPFENKFIYFEMLEKYLEKTKSKQI